jgi:hypothetical protein
VVFTETLSAARNSAWFVWVLIGLWVFSIFKQVKLGADGPLVKAWVAARSYMRNVK